MTQKPVVRRRGADEDIEDTIAYYFSEAGVEIATAFANRLEEALQKISRHPAIGSPRYGHSLQIAHLRHLPMTKFPHLIFYVEKDRHIEIVRVLHSRTDIPAWLNNIE